MAFDLFSLDILDEDVARFRSYQNGVVIEGSELPGKVAIVSTETLFRKFPDAVCYTPEEIRQLLNMSNGDAKLAHEIKSKFGGTLRVKR
jgi:hypothetical protein